jgi:hypothetical protein
MNEATGVLLTFVAVVLLAATLLLVVIPEPPERVVVATERLDAAVLEFRNTSKWDGVDETLRSRIESRLVNAPSIDVFSRLELDALLIEQMLAAGGTLDPTTAVEIGALTGVTKLITGTVFAVNTPSREVTICSRWADDKCVETIPGTEYTVTVQAQIEVIDAGTGKIDRSIDLTGTEGVIAEYGDLCCGGLDALVAKATTEIADLVAANLSTAYTREFRYGLFHSAEPKRAGFVGEDDSTRFTNNEVAYLIVHFTRAEDRDLFDLEWVDSDDNTIDRVEDVIADGDWRLYEIALDGLEPGRYWAKGFLNDTPAFEAAFSVTTADL